MPTPPSAYARAVSRNIRMLMAGEKVTRQQIADAIGVTDMSSVSRRLNGPGEFSLSDLAAIAPLFGTTAATLADVEG